MRLCSWLCAPCALTAYALHRLPTRSPAGHYLAANPLVTTAAGAKAALCERCEGCPATQCTATGCAVCSGTLNQRVDSGKKNLAGQAVNACRAGATPDTAAPVVSTQGVGNRRALACCCAFLVALPAQPPTFILTPTAPPAPQYFMTFPNAAIPNSLLYPNSEFGGCGQNNHGQYILDFTSYGVVKPAVWCVGQRGPRALPWRALPWRAAAGDELLAAGKLHLSWGCSPAEPRRALCPPVCLPECAGTWTL